MAFVSDKKMKEVHLKLKEHLLAVSSALFLTSAVSLSPCSIYSW